MKIVYCINSIGSGGVEQITVFKATALAEIDGNSVWIIYTDSPMEGAYLVPSPKINLIDLELCYRDNHLKFPWNLFRLLRNGIRHKKLLSAKLREIKPDIVVSTGQKEQWFLPSIKGKWAKVRELHVSRGARLKIAKNLRERILYGVLEYLEFSRILTKYDSLVVPTQYEKEAAWGNDNRVSVIPNPVRFSDAGISSLDNKVLVAAGRLEPGKNYSSLIRAFRIVCDSFADWKLVILGEGTEQTLLQELAKNLDLSGKVYFTGFVKNVETFLFNSSVFVHTSLYETFGMVIIEAMRCGLPAVAYDCPYGPRSIISDGTDGFIVPVGDERLLAERICTLIRDESLRKKMGAAALKKAKRYDIGMVTSEWMEFFSKLKDLKQV